ncbi:hypothetical protein HPB49_008674 [Dermacentor silvarum]|uniref:Uncharacterized protein n=1 Tax=Dermacentor silvarum TaxID=543639 RepID=A0ACB8C8E2_DERSI|nr:hypothetical protein HPB49_008674 [Dermacentor silvarum]
MSAGGEETALVAAQPLPAGCRSRPFSAPSCSQPLRRMLLDAGGSRPVTRPLPVACAGGGLELLLPASANPLCARLARDCHEQNATVSRLSCGRLSLITTRALCAGEELRPWLSPALLAELGVPVALTPAHIRGHRCYACPDCGAVFEQPNPLKAHLALDACMRQAAQAGASQARVRLLRQALLAQVRPKDPRAHAHRPQAPGVPILPQAVQ